MNFSPFQNSSSSSSCMPPSWSQNSPVFVTNICMIVVVGGLGNLLTLVSVPWAARNHPDRFPHLCSLPTLLLLHLSLCDLLYLLLGLPMSITSSVLSSNVFCDVATVVRNMVAVADFYTMAAIALTRSIGILQSLGFKEIFYKGKLSSCWALVVIWVLSFLNNSFFIWSVLDIDMFGYDISEMVIGVILPCFTTFISYLSTGLYLRYHLVHHKEPTNHQSTIKQTKLQVHLFMLTIAYLIFMIPMIVVDTGFVTEERVSRILYSVYWWMFSVNFIIYLIFIKDFQTIYSMFLRNAGEYVTQCFYKDKE